MRKLRIALCGIGLVLGIAVSPVFGTANYLIHFSQITVELSRDGKIVGVVLGKKEIAWHVLGQTHLAGCRVEGPVESQKEKDGGVRFKKSLVCAVNGTRREVRLVEDFFPTKDSVRWEMQLEGVGSAWSTAIETTLSFPKAEEAKFWTTWSDPRPTTLAGTEDRKKFADDV